MAASPPLSPVVATPLGHRKRRHSEMTRDGTVVGSAEDAAEAQTAAESPVDPVDDEDEEIEEVIDEEQEESLVEDILDSAEMEPYQPDEDNDATGLKADVAQRLREHLLRVGPEKFCAEIANDDIPPSALGTAFGLGPTLEETIGEELFMRVLGNAIFRFYRKRQKLPQYNTIDDTAELLKGSQNILVITGAGISTSLGIPDFRSKNTGFYSKLQAAGFNEPEEVFDIFEFDEDPTTFYSLAHAVLPDGQRFSPTHAFIRLLQDKGKLQTNYTQNIDNLEQCAGIEAHRLIQCHGSFATASCRKCKSKIEGSQIFPDIVAQRVARCQRCMEIIAAAEAAQKKKAQPNAFRCLGDEDDDSVDDDIPEPGVMKPDITFFGEQLPDTFFDRLTEHDSQTVDLVLVIGTSLKVAPVSEIPNYLPHAVPHIYISREPVEHVNFDVQLLGDCDAVVFELCKRAGWDLTHEMIPNGHKVDVEAVEGSGHRWTVKVKEDAPSLGAEGVDDAVQPSDAAPVDNDFG